MRRVEGIDSRKGAKGEIARRPVHKGREER